MKSLTCECNIRRQRSIYPGAAVGTKKWWCVCLLALSEERSATGWGPGSSTCSRPEPLQLEGAGRSGRGPGTQQSRKAGASICSPTGAQIQWLPWQLDHRSCFLRHRPDLLSRSDGGTWPTLPPAPSRHMQAPFSLEGHGTRVNQPPPSCCRNSQPE